MGAAILKLVAVITRDFNIMDEEVPEAVVDKSDELAHTDIIMDVNGESGTPGTRITQQTP